MSTEAVQPPSGHGEVSHLPPVGQTADRLLDSTSRRGGKRDPRRGKRPGQPLSGGSSGPPPAAPRPEAGPGAAPAAGETNDGHVDYYI
jgi:hypothetical protein